MRNPDTIGYWNGPGPDADPIEYLHTTYECECPACGAHEPHSVVEVDVRSRWRADLVCECVLCGERFPTTDDRE